MANEIELQFKTGESNVYACVFNQAGEVYDRVEFLSWNDLDIDDYAITLTETGGGKFYGDFPIIAAGDYSITAYQGTKIVTDIFLDAGNIAWDGTAEVVLATETKQDRMAAIQEGDEIIDLTTDPGLARRKVQAKGTSTVLLKKKLYKSDGTTPVTSSADEIGREINESI